MEKKYMSSACLRPFVLASACMIQMGYARPKGVTTQVTTQNSPRIGLGTDLRTGQPDSRWQSKIWSSEDSKFSNARRLIERQFYAGAEKTKASRTFVSYQRASIERPLDALATYRRAYSAYLIQKHRVGIPSEAFYAFVWDVARVPVPPSAEYARMRYFVEKQAFGSKARVKQLGERLIRRFPNDYYLKEEQLDLLSFKKNAEVRRAFLYVKDLMRMRPNTYRPYAELAHVHERLYIRANLVRNHKIPEGKPGSYKWVGGRGQNHLADALSVWRQSSRYLPKSDRRYQVVMKKIERIESTGRLR